MDVKQSIGKDAVSIRMALAFLDARKKKFGEFLKKLRVDRGWSLREVEERTGGMISNAYLSQLESGERNVPSMDIIAALSKVFNEPFLNFVKVAGFMRRAEMAQPIINQEEQSLLEKYASLSYKGRKLLLDFADLLKKQE